MTRINTSGYLFLAVACIALAAVNASFSMVQTSETVIENIPRPKGAKKIKDKALGEEKGHFFNEMPKLKP